jgi:hypothetical protein
VPLFRKSKPDIPVNVDLLRQHVQQLSGIRPPRNHLNLKSLNRAADYISAELQRYGYQTLWQGFQVRGGEYGNVLASAGPEEGPRLVVGAHYDVCGDTPGADDNASAVAGLLELARLTSRLKPKLADRLEFAAYALEEPPFYATQDMGSAFHARALHTANADVLGMICLEMLGYYDTARGSQRYPAPGMGLIYPRQGDGRGGFFRPSQFLG